MKRSPSAAALALAAILGTLAAPAAPSSPGGGVPAVSQQAQSTPDQSGTQQTPTSATAQQPMDDPRKRLRYQAHNWKRQVRRKMEEQGFVTSGRQWKLLLRQVQRMRRFDKSVLAMLSGAERTA